MRNIAKTVSADRFAAWRERAKSNGMKPLFDYIRGSVRPGLTAVRTEHGVTADLKAILSQAEGAWLRNLTPPLAA